MLSFGMDCNFPLIKVSAKFGVKHVMMNLEDMLIQFDMEKNKHMPLILFCIIRFRWQNITHNAYLVMLSNRQL